MTPNKNGKREVKAWLTEVVSGRQKLHCGCRLCVRIILGNLPCTWGERLKYTVVVAGKRFNRVLFPLRWPETKEIQEWGRKRASQPRAGHQPIKSSDFIKCAAYPVFILKQVEPTKLITRWARNIKNTSACLCVQEGRVNLVFLNLTHSLRVLWRHQRGVCARIYIYINFYSTGSPRVMLIQGSEEHFNRTREGPLWQATIYSESEEWWGDKGTDYICVSRAKKMQNWELSKNRTCRIVTKVRRKQQKYHPANFTEQWGNTWHLETTPVNRNRSHRRFGE